MNVLFYTTDLFAGRERLMPWRTVIEVAKVMQEQGHRVLIANGVGDCDHVKSYSFQGVLIQSVSKKLENLVWLTKTMEADALFVECKWRDALRGFAPLKEVTCKKFAYFTGGVYDLQSAMRLSLLCGLWNGKASWMESLVPKHWLAKKLKHAAFDGVIGLTGFTADKAGEVGCPHVVTILPGKDSFEEIKSDESVVQKRGLKDKRFICFTGAPAPTRGAGLLLKAADEAEVADLRVVFLMRTDVGSDYANFDMAYKRMKHKDRVVIVKETLSREQLKAFFESAWYMALPFIVVPSEIPLTFFEIMSCGTPVLTFRNGGTSDYLKKGLLIADKSVKGLRVSLEKSWSDDALRAEKAESAKRMMNGHPTWETVAKEWMDLIK